MEAGSESQQPAYGHPTTAIAHVLFKVLSSEKAWLLLWTSKTSKGVLAQSPIALTPHAVLQAAALAFYIVCGFLSLGFVTNFVIIIVCLMLDFWIVRFPVLPF